MKGQVQRLSLFLNMLRKGGISASQTSVLNACFFSGRIIFSYYKNTKIKVKV